MNETELNRIAKINVARYFSFYIHAFVYLVVILFLAILNFLFSDGHVWFIYPAGGWLIGLFAHGFFTFIGVKRLYSVLIKLEKIRLRIFSGH